MSNNDVLVNEFPKWGLLPKKETGVLNLLNKYPDFDGRGTIIAIFDSGTDPGAAGLQITSEGKPKIIERYDCSGAGDVDTSTVVKPEDGYITGISGRKLKIPKSWNNPSGEYFIGIKNAYDLYPKIVQDRIQKERKDKLWDPYHRKAQAEAQKKLQEFLEKNPDTKSNSLSRENKLLKEELEGMVESLNTLEKKLSEQDPGPSYDVVVFHNGTHYCACIDTTEKGDLAACRVLGEYSVTRDYQPLTTADQLNYSINVHDEGKLTEIVGLCSSHGTHVASIASAYFPEEPEKNGVAPGAQIISCCIGDNRLSTMETGTAIARAMITVMKSKKVDVINMSYGERAHWNNTSRLADLMNEVVDKYGVVWLCSAGNKGPALCTVGCPPDITSTNIIGIGAYVSPEMMEAEYALRDRLPSTVFTWSSRGPCQDGAKGVTVVAPGAAITSVANFSLRGSQHMNGTSMSSPHACGAVSLIISSLKQKNIPYTPYSIRRALENTAQYLDNVEVFAQGFGLLQVEKVIEWLDKYNQEKETKVRFHITCGPTRSKGIHLRLGDQQSPQEMNVSVQPVFFDADNIDPKEKIAFQMSLSLTCSESWVQFPNHLEIMNITRDFSVKIDPTALAPGVYNTSIRAFDSNKPQKGHVFAVEITVVKPHVIKPNLHVKPEITFKDIEFKSNTVKHHFVMVPKEATIAVLKFQAITPNSQGRFVVHCNQLKPKLVNSMEVHKLISLNTQSEQNIVFQVIGDQILEVTVAKYWSHLDEMKLNYSIGFRGCKPNHDLLSLYQLDGIQRVEINGGVQTEEVSPSLVLKQSVVVLKPSEHKISPLSVRDVVPPNRQIYELVLTYNFHIGKSTEVTPYNTNLSDLLYESPFESQLWLLYDDNKRLVAVGDAYSEKYHYKLEKGDYTIHHQIRHEKKDLLEKLTDSTFSISQKLQNNFSLDIFSCMNQALTGGKKMNSTTIKPGNTIYPIYIPPLPHDKLKNITAQYLTGTITYSKEESLKKVDTYPVRFYLSDGAKKVANNSSANKTDKDKTKEEEFEESVRDHKTGWLSKLEKGEASDKLFNELRQSYPQHVFIYTAMFQCLEPDTKKLLPGFKSEYKAEDDERLIEVANMALDVINQSELLAYLGIKTDSRNEASKTKQQMDRQKAVLVDALSRKGVAMCRIYLSDPTRDVPGIGKITLESIDEIYITLQMFVDPADNKNGVYFLFWHAAVFKHYGRLTKILLKQLDDKYKKELVETLIWTSQQAKLTHCETSLQSSLPVVFPAAYRLL